jgi:hypothetical protein
MAGRLRRAIVLVIAAGCALALAAVAAGSRQRTIPLPSLPSLALAPADFQSGATVAQDSTMTDAGQPVLVRRFAAGARIADVPLLTVVDEVELYCDAGASARDFVLLQNQFASKSGPLAFAKDFAHSLVSGSKGKLKVTRTDVGSPVTLDAASLRLAVTFATNFGRLPMAIDLVQVDRVLTAVFVVGLYGQKVAGSDAAHVAAAAEARLKAAFTVSAAQAPTVSGQAQQGQMLTVDEGTWLGAPSSFSYAWARCDATGNACAPVVGATDKTYTPTAADSCFALRVTVTGTNAVGSQQADSAPTAAVP